MFNEDRLEKGLWWDRAWNLVFGCTHVSESCDNCWSRRESYMKRNNPHPKIKERYQAVVDAAGDWKSVGYCEENLEIPKKRKKPTVWSVWNDLFHDAVPPIFIEQALGIIEACPQHLFIILTKRPTNANVYIRTLRNRVERMRNILWGVTVESNHYLDRIGELILGADSHSFGNVQVVLSIEPLLGEIHESDLVHCFTMYPQIKWVIVGGESGHGCRPTNLDNVRLIRDRCADFHIPFFFKQVGGHPNKRSKNKDIPEDLWIRELPNIPMVANVASQGNLFE